MMTPRYKSQIDMQHMRESELRRQEEKGMLEKYRDYFQFLATQFQQSHNKEEQAWGLRVLQLIESRKSDDHFWFLIWKQVEKRNLEIGDILNQHTHQTKELMKFVQGIIDDIVRVTNLEGEARKDNLTGLSNKRKLLEDMEACSEHPTGKSIGILYIDLDKIKIANDKYGHNNTDLIFIEIANRMKKIADLVFERSRGVIEVSSYRIGGDEMGFLIQTSNLLTSEQYKQLITLLVSFLSEQPYETISGTWEQQVSCGAICVSDYDLEKNTSDILNMADGFQYLSKLTAGEARTPPEEKVAQLINPLIEQHRDVKRGEHLWSVVFCDDIYSLYNKQPKVEYMFPKR